MEIKKLFPDEKVIVTEYFDVHQDWETPIPGFFIISSIRSINSIGEFTPEEEIEFIRLSCCVRKGMKEVLGIDDVYLFQRESSKYHFHMWIFPRYPWMEDFGTGTRSLMPIVNYAKENMADEKNFKEVKIYVSKIKKYMGKMYY